MHKREKQESSIQNSGTASSSLTLLFGFKKIKIAICSICKTLRLKACYGNKISIKWINSIRHTFTVTLKENAQCTIGNFLMVDGPLYIKAEGSAKVSIGNEVFFNHNCSITSMESVTIGNKCNIANNVVIVDHDHMISGNGVVAGYNTAAVEIGDNVWIGANVTILKGTHIGNGAVIAAGAVVNCDVPSCEVWGGVPVKRIRATPHNGARAFGEGFCSS